MNDIMRDAMKALDTEDAQTKAALAELNARGVTAPIELSGARPETIAFWARTTLAALPARVQVLHIRTPDYECSVQVWLDGVPIEADVEDIDPGRGYNRSDWDERVEAAREDESGYGKTVLAALLDNADSNYITEGNEHA